jgi:hypothetical protein
VVETHKWNGSAVASSCRGFAPCVGLPRPSQRQLRNRQKQRYGRGAAVERRRDSYKSFHAKQLPLAYGFARVHDYRMDRFVQEQIRLQTALVEVERQRVKLLISTGNAIALKQYALSARADLEKTGRIVKRLGLSAVGGSDGGQ